MSHLPDFTHHRPSTLEGALALLSRLGPGAQLLAGGTEILPKLRAGRPGPEHLVSLGAIESLRTITFDAAAGLQIGAGARVRDVADHPAVQAHYPALARACTEMATVQIRNMATVAGNLVNGSPCADTAGPLLAHDATLHLALASGSGSARNERGVALDAFFQGPGQVDLRPGELLTRICVPPPEPRSGEAFLRLSARSRVDIAAASATARLVLDAAGKIALARVVLGAVAPTPLRCPGAEAILLAQVPGADLFRRAALEAQALARPISDVRATASYRKAVVPVLVRRALSACAESLAVKTEGGAT